MNNLSSACRGCSETVELPVKQDEEFNLIEVRIAEEKRAVVCPLCFGLYCIECDIFVH
jgi:hypothetical protein